MFFLQEFIKCSELSEKNVLIDPTTYPEIESDQYTSSDSKYEDATSSLDNTSELKYEKTDQDLADEKSSTLTGNQTDSENKAEKAEYLAHGNKTDNKRGFVEEEATKEPVIHDSHGDRPSHHNEQANPDLLLEHYYSLQKHKTEKLTKRPKLESLNLWKED